MSRKYREACGIRYRVVETGSESRARDVVRRARRLGAEDVTVDGTDALIRAPEGLSARKAGEWYDAVARADV